MDISGKKILITCGGGVGDIIMYTPALRRLKEKYGCYITFLTPRNPELVTGLSYIDEVIYMKRGVFLSKFRNLHKLVGYDAVIITDWQPNVLMAAKLFGVPIRAGFPREESSISKYYNKVLTHKWYKTLDYVGDNNARMISQALDVELDGDMTHCDVSNPSKADKTAVNQALQEIGLQPNSKFVILSPFTNFALKNWPMASCQKLVQLITDKYNLPVVMLGGPGDYEAASKISKYNLSGKTTIGQMVELISRAAVMVTADSGPMHVAGAVGIPIVAVFGKEVPERWAPKRNCWPITLRYPCSPCKDSVAEACDKKVQCLRDITAEMVMEKLQEIL